MVKLKSNPKKASVKKSFGNLGKRLKFIARSISRYLRLHPKRTRFVILVIILLSINSILFYRLGQNKSSTTGSTITTITASDKSDNTKQGKNSGFLRLSGTVVKASDSTLSIKLDAGNVVTFSVKKDSKYYDNDRKSHPVGDLSQGSKVLVISTVEPSGVFMASSIRLDK